MGDDRRRFADPDGMPSAFGGALSQAGRGPRARGDGHGRQRDLRCRQRHGLSRPGRARRAQGQSRRRRGLGHAHGHLLRRDQGHGVSGDMILGGVRNLIETHTSSGALFANITPNTHMMSYQTSEEKLAGVFITEKVDRKTGWQYVCIEEEWTRGYVQEIQDFMECVASGRQPLSDLALAFETIKVNYAGYWAAEEGRRVVL